MFKLFCSSKTVNLFHCNPLTNRYELFSVIFGTVLLHDRKIAEKRNLNSNIFTELYLTLPNLREKKDKLNIWI